MSVQPETSILAARSIAYHLRFEVEPTLTAGYDDFRARASALSPPESTDIADAYDAFRDVWYRLRTMPSDNREIENSDAVYGLASDFQKRFIFFDTALKAANARLAARGAPAPTPEVRLPAPVPLPYVAAPRVPSTPSTPRPSSIGKAVDGGMGVIGATTLAATIGLIAIARKRGG
jgi:hypothetical protein